jgi:hypothetical protein
MCPILPLNKRYLRNYLEVPNGKTIAGAGIAIIYDYA